MVNPDIKAFVERTIDQNFVAFFGKSYCPFCAKAKELLRTKKIAFQIVELDQVANGAEIQAYLKEKTGQATVPNVFIQKKHVGGNSDLMNANTNGSLDIMLKGAPRDAASKRSEF